MFNWFFGLIDLYWNKFLGTPIQLVFDEFEWGTPTALQRVAIKAVFTGLVLFLIGEMILRSRERKERKKNRALFREMMSEKEEGHVLEKNVFGETLEAMQAPEQKIEELKKAKKFDQLAVVYASLGRCAEAAKAFEKAKQPQRAAAEWAKAGETLKAAKLLEELGDLGGALALYEAKGEYQRAAQLHAKQGDVPNQARCLARAGKGEEAARVYAAMFNATPPIPWPAQLHLADACHAWLRDPVLAAGLRTETRQGLLRAVAARFEHAGRRDLAASVYREGGDRARAAELYRQLGKTHEAGQCLRGE